MIHDEPGDAHWFDLALIELSISTTPFDIDRTPKAVADDEKDLRRQ